MKSVEQVEKEFSLLRELFKNNYYRLWLSNKGYTTIQIVIDEETVVEINTPNRYLKFLGMKNPD
jgi:membrane-anchored protein YejM (alkaline phosphatase superfamily)